MNGRKMVTLARDYTLDKFKGSTLIYGDTDSIFVSFVDYIKEIILQRAKPPPPIQENVKTSHIKVERNICSSCFKEYSKEDMSAKDLGICKFCYNNSDMINKFNKQFEK